MKCKICGSGNAMLFIIALLRQIIVWKHKYFDVWRGEECKIICNQEYKEENKVFGEE